MSKIHQYSPPPLTLSKLEYYAAAALQGFCANQKALTENVNNYKKMERELGIDRPEFPAEMLALTCIKIAEAMIKVEKEIRESGE